jgi:hypothetical protein
MNPYFKIDFLQCTIIKISKLTLEIKDNQTQLEMGKNLKENNSISWMLIKLIRVLKMSVVISSIKNNSIKNNKN